MRILLAEDDAVSRKLLESRLQRWDYEVILANDGLEAWQILQEKDAPRLAILDWIMPGLDGIQVCQELRARGGEPYIYVLLLTAKDAKEDVIQGLEAGADDYLTKPFNSQELKVRLRVGRRIVELQGELISAREALREQATHDSLTGLLNRGAILEMLQQELTRACREHRPLAVCMADVDYFKRVNDRLGHVAGDAVLVQIARRLQSSLRSYDGIGRYGGEEFLLILPNCERSAANSRIEKLRATIAAEPVNLPQEAIFVTMSFGMFLADGGHPPDLQKVLRAADHALYSAKHSGRNCICLASPD